MMIEMVQSSSINEEITMKQRDAVYSAVTSVLSDAGVHFEDGMDVATMLSKEYRGAVQAIVVEGFTSGKIAFEASEANQEKLSNPAKLNAYVSGLISNWIRKDKRLNGNTSYVAKNPGSRAGASDEQLKTLRALKKQFAGTDKESIIEAQITKRVSEIRSEKTKSAALTEEQLAALPDDVRESLGL
jgi:hypothetical protein